MKCHYKSRSGRMVFEVEAQTEKELFRAIGCLQEIFESDAACGCCSGTDLVFRVRQVGKFQYYELHYRACSADLTFGTRQDSGRLFPRRKDAHGTELPDRGWRVWQGRLDDDGTAEWRIEPRSSPRPSPPPSQ